MDAPGMRNSNLLPVKAKGEVRLRSVVSARDAGQGRHAHVHDWPCVPSRSWRAVVDRLCSTSVQLVAQDTWI